VVDLVVRVLVGHSNVGNIGDVLDWDVSALSGPYCVSAIDMRGLESDQTESVEGQETATVSGCTISGASFQ